MKTTLAAATLIAASSLPLFANGGGYATGLNFTGSVAPFEAEGVDRVMIVRENLDIVLGADSAEVRVRYEMKNLMTSTAKVRFGFPVERVKGMQFEAKPPAEATAYCKNYTVTAGGKKVKAEYLTDPVTSGKVAKFPGSEVFNGIEGWMVSEVKFPAGETQVIEIRYDSDYEVKSFSISDSGTTEPRRFRYRLSTGAVWNGPIGQGTVRVRVAEGVNAAPVKVVAPANRFKKDPEGGWVWHFTGLEPTLADDIVIHTTEEHFSTRDYTQSRRGISEAYERIGSKWFWQHTDYTASASSTLTSDNEHDYAAAGVKNPDDYETFLAWVEGKEDDGIGESITLTQKSPAPVAAILVRPGFGKDKSLWQANNRPRTLKITLNGKHTFTAPLEDKDTRQRIPVQGFTGDVKTVKLEIADVYRGTQFRDTAISHVSLIRPLVKEPKFTGPR